LLLVAAFGVLVAGFCCPHKTKAMLETHKIAIIFDNALIAVFEHSNQDSLPGLARAAK
jgi:hypothetical protein